MARFFHNTLRIPHIQNATERVRVLRFFLRGFSIGCLLLQSCVITISLLVRFKLGFPVQCSGFPEKVYAPTYTLIGMAAAMWLVLVCGLVKINSLKTSGHIKGVCVAYLTLNVFQFLVILVSRLHSSGYSNTALLQKYSHVFSKGCLDRIQRTDLCCGFQNYTEWLEAFSSSQLGSNLYGEYFISNVEQISGRQQIRSLERIDQGFFSKSAFPESCWCSSKRSSSCYKVSYKMRPLKQNNHIFTNGIKINPSTSSSVENPSMTVEPDTSIEDITNKTSLKNSTFNSLDLSTITIPATITDSSNLTTDRITTPRPQQDPDMYAKPPDHAYIHTKPCIDSLVEHFKTVDISAAATAVVSSSASLAVFLFGYFLIHNLEGAVTVSDIYQTPPTGTHQGDNSTSPSAREENSPTPAQLEQENPVIVLGSIAHCDKRTSAHDLTHFQINHHVVHLHCLPQPLDEKDIHTTFPE